ncbi:MAG: hypothetical protein AAF798_01575 [Bacteroidota bacterium]
MHTINNSPSTPLFGRKQFLKAALPSYFAPWITPGLPAYFMGNEELLRASYTSIAIPSLLATIICFFILAYFQRKQIFLLHRFRMVFLLGIPMILLALLLVYLLNLEAYTFDIVLSAFIGTAIVTLTNPLQKIAV